MTIPIAFLNAYIASRKGRNPVLFLILGFIPFVGFYLTIYLLSLTDKLLMDKIDKILNVLEQR